MEQPKQINNTSERLVDDLKSRLSTQSRISIAAASFSIYAFEAMKAELEKVGGSTLYLHLANLCGRQDEERAATAKEICLASELHAAKKEAGGTYLVICKM